MNNNISIMLFAMVGGVLLSMQGGLNSQLGVLLRNPLLATLVAYLFSTLFAIILVSISIKSVPSIEQLKEIPKYLWFRVHFLVFLELVFTIILSQNWEYQQ